MNVMNPKDVVRRIFYSIERYIPKPLTTILLGFHSHGVKRTLKSSIQYIRMDKTGSPTHISDLEWDNLIIIDACRHDLYEEVRGKTDFINSPASSSNEFIYETFRDQDWSDTVIVTANPFFMGNLFRNITGRQPEEVFHDVIYCIKDDWDNELGTVPPDRVKEQTVNARMLYPDKKIITWFIQPHHPFIEGEFETTGMTRFQGSGEKVWELARSGSLSSGEIWQAYRRNLEIVMEEVDELAESLNGRTVLTSDHGNFVGEYGLYGHPAFAYGKPVKKVPFEVLNE